MPFCHTHTHTQKRTLSCYVDWKPCGGKKREEKSRHCSFYISAANLCQHSTVPYVVVFCICKERRNVPSERAKHLVALQDDSVIFKLSDGPHWTCNFFSKRGPARALPLQFQISQKTDAFNYCVVLLFGSFCFAGCIFLLCFLRWF